MPRRDAMEAAPTQSNRAYTLAQYGNDERGGYRGNFFCDDNKVDPWKLAWMTKRSQHGVTTLRICPGRNPDNPEELDPFILEDGNFGDFARVYWTWRAGGDPSATFLMYDPVASPHYDMDDNPAQRIYSAARNVIAQDEHHPWSVHLKGGAGRGALLVAPKKCWLVQALMYEHGDKNYEVPKGAADGDTICLIDLGKDAGNAMIRLLSEETDNYQGEPGNADARFVHGNPIDLDSPTSAFFRFYPLQAGSPAAREQSAAQTTQRGASAGGTLGGRRQTLVAEDRTQIGFGVELADTFAGVDSQFGDEDIDFLYNKIKPWDEVLKFHDNDRQAEILSTRVPFEVLEYAWRDHPEWMPSADSDQARGGRGAVSSGGGFGRGGAAPAADAPAAEAPPAGRTRSRRAATGAATAVAPGDRFDDDATPPNLPEGMPEAAAPVARTSRRAAPAGRALGAPAAEAPAAEAPAAAPRVAGSRTGGRSSARLPAADAAAPAEGIPDDEYDPTDAAPAAEAPAAAAAPAGTRRRSSRR
jgi:hypothetical protein